MTTSLRTQDLRIRPFRTADGPEVVRLLNDYSVSKWLAAIPHPFRTTDLRLMHPDGTTRWPDLAAIETGTTLLGAISMRPAHLGLWLGADFWSRGYGGQATRAAISFIFSKDAPQIVSSVFEGNLASLKIFSRLGFRETGRRLSPCLARGEDITTIDLRLSREDWTRAEERAR